MKICVHCRQPNEDAAARCFRCRHSEFAPAPSPAQSASPHSQSRSSKPSPEFLIAEREGKVTVLKCRTPGEAFLVAAELEAAEILVLLPEEEALTQEFTEHGYISLRVSARSYEAAQELQRIVDRKHWEERTQAPLPVPMILVALALGCLPVPGCFVFFMLNDMHLKRGYHRKAKTFRNWFCLGIALLIGICLILSSCSGR